MERSTHRIAPVSSNTERRTASPSRSRSNYRQQHSKSPPIETSPHNEGRNKIIQCMISPKVAKPVVSEQHLPEHPQYYTRDEGATIVTIERYLKLDTSLSDDAIQNVLGFVKDTRLSNATVIKRIKDTFRNLTDEKHMIYWRGVSEYIKHSIDPASNKSKQSSRPPSTDVLNDGKEANISANKPLDSGSNEHIPLKGKRSHLRTPKPSKINMQRKEQSTVETTGSFLDVEDTEIEIVSSRSFLRSLDESNVDIEEVVEDPDNDRKNFYNAAKHIQDAIAAARQNDQASIQLLQRFPQVSIEFDSRHWSIRKVIRRILIGVAAIRKHIAEVEKQAAENGFIDSGSDSEEEIMLKDLDKTFILESLDTKVSSETVTDFLEMNWGGLEEDFFNSIEQDSEGRFLIKQYDSTGKEYTILYDHEKDALVDAEGTIIVRAGTSMKAQGQRKFYDVSGREVINVPFLNRYDTFYDDKGKELVNIASMRASKQQFYDEDGKEVIVLPEPERVRRFYNEKKEFIGEIPYTYERYVNTDGVELVDFPFVPDTNLQIYDEDGNNVLNYRLHRNEEFSIYFEEDGESKLNVGILTAKLSYSSQESFTEMDESSSHRIRTLSNACKRKVSKPSPHMQVPIARRKSRLATDGREIVNIPVEVTTSRPLFTKKAKPLTRSAKDLVQVKKQSWASSSTRSSGSFFEEDFLKIKTRQPSIVKIPPLNIRKSMVAASKANLAPKPPERKPKPPHQFLKKPTTLDIPKDYPVAPCSAKVIQAYMQKHGICQLFEKLTSSLVIERPSNPLDFLLQLVHEIGTCQTQSETLYQETRRKAMADIGYSFRR